MIDNIVVQIRSVDIRRQIFRCCRRYADRNMTSNRGFTAAGFQANSVDIPQLLLV